jgi:hypothetical protein
MAKKPHPGGWSTKRYILAALFGTLVATAVIMAVCAVLRPGKVVFTVTGLKNGRLSEGKRLLSLTLTANNTSNRSGLQYRSLIAYLKYTAHDETPYEVPVEVNGGLPPRPQMPGTRANISMSCTLWGEAIKKSSSGVTPNMSVEVLAVVRFKVALAYSRPYNVRVLCDPFDYLSAHPKFPITCSE